MHPKLAARVPADVLQFPISGLPLSELSWQFLTSSKDIERHRQQIESLRLRSSSASLITSQLDWQAVAPMSPGWRKRVLLLHHGQDLQAVVLLRERTLAGIPLGYFRAADTCNETIILCAPGREASYLALVFNLLFTRHRAFLAFLCQPAEKPKIALRASGLRLSTSRSAVHWQTPLRQSLDATIEHFGRRTRRNIRHCLRQIEANGWRLQPQLTDAEMSAAFHDLEPRATHRLTPGNVEDRLKVVRETAGHFAMALVDRDGRWLSCLVGNRTAKGTDILWQVNAAGYRSASLCLMMRVLMMQEEIRRGSPLIRYIAGTCPLMEHTCVPEPSHETLIVRPGLRLALTRLLLRAAPLGRSVAPHQL